MIRSLHAPALGPTNTELADVLGQMAELLVRRGEPNPYRVHAYLQAAAMLRSLDTPAAEIYGEGGREALTELPGIGVNLAQHLAEYIERGRVGLRDRLMASGDPAALLATVPGIGEALAERLVASGIRTLTSLESAAHDGRLAQIAGIGPRRLEAIRLQLNSILHRSARRRVRRVRRQVARLSALRHREEEARAEATQQATAISDETTVATIYPLFPPAAA
ncbi:MAG: helix-hairpin-helix domain-containing protein [Bacteroidota bacterium]